MKIQTLLYSILFLILTSCSAANISRLRKSNMELLELGMSKVQVSNILGTAYTIAEKKIEAKDTIEVLSYRNFPYDDELYLFRFKNNQLESWHREFTPTFKENKN